MVKKITVDLTLSLSITPFISCKNGVGDVLYIVGLIQIN